MKKFLMLFFLLTLVTNAHSQYTLVPAFPDLSDFQAPLDLVNSGDGTNRLFLVQEWGLIYVFNNSPTVSTKKVFLDITNKIATFAQTGILGIAFHPSYETNRYFYVHYIYENASQTGFVTRISRFTASSNNPDTALSSTELTMMDLPVEYPGHYGGKISFGVDGYLYISLGDAGTGASGGHLAQDLTSLKGKLLRIDVNIPSGGLNYSSPASNPFFNNVQGYKKEIYAYGFRNMWKFSFDPVTNVLWGADVGEHLFEEIDHIQKGKNYGWNKMEGFHCYNWPDTTLCDTAGRGFTRPIYEYPHTLGKSITGGHVFRGSRTPELYGKYIYADFIKGTVWALSYPAISNTLILDSNYNLSTFGTDEQNELYIVGYSGKIFKLSREAKTLTLSAALEGFYNIAINKMNKDTVKVYLRNTTAPYSIVDSARSILDSNCSTTFNFYNASNSTPYYIALNHRNSLEVWSSSGRSFVSNLLSYNFTTSSQMAYGNNTLMVDNQPIRFASYGGDVNQDGYIDLPDIIKVSNDAQSFASGYMVSDLEGNNFVDLGDILIVFNNATNFVQEIIP